MNKNDEISAQFINRKIVESSVIAARRLPYPKKNKY